MPPNAPFSCRGLDFRIRNKSSKLSESLGNLIAKRGIPKLLTRIRPCPHILLVQHNFLRWPLAAEALKTPSTGAGILFGRKIKRRSASQFTSRDGDSERHYHQTTQASRLQKLCKSYPPAAEPSRTSTQYHWLQLKLTTSQTPFWAWNVHWSKLCWI